MLRRLAVTALALALALAGCLAPGGDDAATPAASAALDVLALGDPMGHDHDHADPALHDFAANFELLAHHPLAGSESTSAGAHALDVKAGHLFVAVYGDTVGMDGGVFIFNVSAPESPELVGRFQFPGSMGGDRSMEASEDGNWLVVGTEPVDCAGHVNPFAPGVLLVDVRDKANPQVVDYYPTSGTHAVAVKTIGDATYVFTVSNAGTLLIDTTLPKARLVQVDDHVIGHDMVILDDPVLGTPLMYAADGAGPLNVYDVSDPTAPQLVATWNIPDRGDEYYVHTVAAEVREDGRRIVVVTSEDWGDLPSPLWVLDATRFDVIETLATWTNPGGHAAEGLRYSLHNPRMHDGVLDLAHYHGGVWRLDLADPATPKVAGVYLPHEGGTLVAPARTGVVADNLCGEFALADAPSTFDVEWHEGVLYAADLHTGLYALRFTG